MKANPFDKSFQDESSKAQEDPETYIKAAQNNSTKNHTEIAEKKTSEGAPPENTLALQYQQNMDTSLQA